MSPNRSTISLDEFRAVAIRAQMLGSESGSLQEVVEKAGFVRTLGGVDVYLALRARLRNFDCRALESAVERQELKVMPAARSCIYLVAGAHSRDTLRFASLQRERRDEREFEKAGIESGELDRLEAIILDTLQERGTLSTMELRRHLPEGSYRSLGAAGRKVGISSTLPPALRQLEFAGRIERLMDGGRLDSEKYVWRASSSHRDRCDERGLEDVQQALAQVFFTASGLATRRMFAEWSGLTQKGAQEALARLALAEYEVEGQPDPFHGFPSQVEQAPAKDPTVVAFLPFEDNLLALRGGPGLMVLREFHEIPVPVWGRSRPSTLGAAKHSTLRTIVAANQVSGFWEFAPDSGQIVTHCFASLGPTLERAIAQEASALAAFIRDRLGHGRSFSLDTDKNLAERARFIRELAS